MRRISIYYDMIYKIGTYFLDIKYLQYIARENGILRFFFTLVHTDSAVLKFPYSRMVLILDDSSEIVVRVRSNVI